MFKRHRILMRWSIDWENLATVAITATLLWMCVFVGWSVL